jgi:hypothetical protein
MVLGVSTPCRTVFSFFHFRGMAAFIFRVVSYVQIDCSSLCQPGCNSSPWRLRQHIWNVNYQLVTPHGVKNQMSCLILHSLSLLRKKCSDCCLCLGSRNTYLICWPPNKIHLFITVIILCICFCTFKFPKFYLPMTSEHVCGCLIIVFWSLVMSFSWISFQFFHK